MHVDQPLHLSPRNPSDAPSKPNWFYLAICAWAIYQLAASVSAAISVGSVHWFTFVCMPFQLWWIVDFLYSLFPLRRGRIGAGLDMGIHVLFLLVSLAAGYRHPNSVAISIGAVGLLVLLLVALTRLPQSIRPSRAWPRWIEGIAVAAFLVPIAKAWDAYAPIAIALLIVFCVNRVIWQARSMFEKRTPQLQA